MKLHLQRQLLIFVILILMASCAPQVRMAPAPFAASVAPISQEIQNERDEIYMLTAYAVVLNDWQVGGQKKRGHNIGSILVDPNGRIVNWARNCNAVLSNGTQHGEVRLMLGYLNRVGGYSLKNHTVYTTLEPCAQCSGMMVLTSIKRTVYGQTDPGFGKALERLSLDSNQWNEAGYRPYPRSVISVKSNNKYCELLDNEYGKIGGSITKFLLTDISKTIYEDAAKTLQNYTVKYSENKEILAHAQATIELVKPGVPTITIRASNKKTLKPSLEYQE
jgi:tRNA(Arg) A34 adenosine deaminase TadA